MRKCYILFVMLFVLIACFENCKREPKITKTTYPDPDSLYQGTPYALVVPNEFPPLTNAFADSLTYEGIQLGRRLFYDKHLSLDGSKSCASCHHLNYSFSDSGLALSTNEFGPTKRNAPVLENLAWNPYFFWDGRQPTPAAQAQDASHNELGLNVVNAIAYLRTDTVYTKLFKKAFGRPGAITENEIYLAIQQFEMSAISANSKFDQVRKGLVQYTTSEALGYQMFITETGDCFHCHMSGDGATLLMTNNLFLNNGLDSAATYLDFRDPGRGGITGKLSDYGTFKVPSLRNCAVSGPYMHDGRFATLMDVINFYSDSEKLSPTINSVMLLPNHANGGLHLDPTQKTAMLDFLNTLTDTSFLHNPNLQDPFKN